MEDIYIVVPNEDISFSLSKMITAAEEQINSIPDKKAIIIREYSNSVDFNNKRLIFAAELNNIYIDIPMLSFLSKLSENNKNALTGCIGTVFIHSFDELGTKRAAQDIIFTANKLGCRFIGHPLVEATGDLSNFLTWQKNLKKSLEEICIDKCTNNAARLVNCSPKLIERPDILVLYSSPHKTSNTLDLWEMISKHLKEAVNITKIQIENGAIQDCKGCSFKLCIHYGKQNSCFYGGYMVENILPAVEKADAVVWLCPNYNDAISANLSATINRLTVLYHKISFYNKSLYGIVVSGNSGSDSVAKQIIGALNINKGFSLPPNSILMETANDPKAIFKINNIEIKAKTFAENILSETKAERSD